MAKIRIPFNRAHIGGREFDYIKQAIELLHLSGGGTFTKRCETKLEEVTGARKAILTTSCTDALEMAALLLKLAPGDEVIVPSFTFSSSANAFVLHGARAVFADIRPDTLNLDETKLEALITPRTRAIVCVHYAGVACDMDALLALCQRRNLVLIEDNAHGLFGQYKGRPLGSFGQLTTLSFHETKNVTCGEGGALLINEPKFVERAEVLRDKGTDRTKFLRGQIDKYSWVDVGSSFLPSEILAAFLWAQLEVAPETQEKRRNVWCRYEEFLHKMEHSGELGLPVVPEYATPAYHLFHVLMPDLNARNALIDTFKQKGILATFHYSPLHLSVMGKKLGADPEGCPVSKQTADRLLRLPFYTDLSIADQKEVLEVIESFLAARKGRRAA